MDFSEKEQVIIDAIVKSKSHKIKAEDIMMVGQVIGSEELTYEVLVKKPRTVVKDGLKRVINNAQRVYISAKEIGLEKEAAAGAKRAAEAG